MVADGSAGMALQLKDVAKVYRGRVHALRGIDLEVGRGEVFGLLGPNGAGKSTLIKILMTVIRPTRCSGHMLGRPVGDKSTLRRVGYLPENHKFPPYLSGRKALHFYGAMSCVPRNECKRRAEQLLTMVGMADWADKKIGGYSKGMRQRIGIAQALMSDPDLVLLDEPTDGVDPGGRRDIRNMLEYISDQGKTVFLNSHILSELEQVCDRVAILVQGEVRQQGTIDFLTEDRARFEIRVARPGGQPPTALASALEDLVKTGEDGKPGLADGSLVDIEGDHVSVLTEQAEAVQPIVDSIRQRGLLLTSLRLARPSLEDLFMEAVQDPTTGRQLGPGAARKGKTS